MQACYLRAFLPHLDDWNSRRARLAALYDEALAGCEGVMPVRRSPESVNHLYVIRAQDREQLRAHLREHGIATAVHYPAPLHLNPPSASSAPKPAPCPTLRRPARRYCPFPSTLPERSCCAERG